MIRIARSNSANSDFLNLVRKLDAELAIRDGEDHAFYSQFNSLEKIRHVVLAYVDGETAGCGAIKEYSAGTMEIKRMFVLADHRRKGIAAKILSELERWSADLAFSKCILETGKKQPEAIELYKKNGYQPIANYGQYTGVENSVCFEKEILPH